MRLDIESVQQKTSQHILQKTESLSNIIQQKDSFIEKLLSSNQAKDNHPPTSLAPERQHQHSPTQKSQQESLLRDKLKKIYIELQGSLSEKSHYLDECNALRSELGNARAQQPQLLQTDQTSQSRHLIY